MLAALREIQRQIRLPLCGISAPPVVIPKLRS